MPFMKNVQRLMRKETDNPARRADLGSPNRRSEEQFMQMTDYRTFERSGLIVSPLTRGTMTFDARR